MTLDLNTILLLAALFLFSGAVMGFLAGLFGVGGGTISVPVLYEAFGVMGLEDGVRMPLAVGTALALIVPTSIQSARGHYRRGSLDMSVLRQWAVPVVIGVLIGSVIARFADASVFKVVFIVVSAVVSIRLLRGAGWVLASSLPGIAVMRVYGLIIGVCSSLMGIGGGSISNLVLSLYGTPIHRSVSTSAGVGLLISIPGTFGYIFAGWGKTGLPWDALGYVSVIGFLALLPTSLITTRYGVALAHKLSRRHLELAFGLFLAAVCLRFVVSLFV